MLIFFLSPQQHFSGKYHTNERTRAIVTLKMSNLKSGLCQIKNSMRIYLTYHNSFPRNFKRHTFIFSVELILFV